jgi:hypothetical protein
LLCWFKEKNMNQEIKKFGFAGVTAILTAAVFVLAGCENAAVPPWELNSASNTGTGRGTVSIGIAGVEGTGGVSPSAQNMQGDLMRTVYPVLNEFTKYAASFEPTAGGQAHAPVEITGGSSGEVELAEGTYTVTVTGYTLVGDTETASAEWTEQGVVITAGGKTEKTATLGPKTGAGNGTFCYNITLAGGLVGVASATLTVTTESGGAVAGGTVNLLAGSGQGTLTLAAGSYLAAVTVVRGTGDAKEFAGFSHEVVHIYAGLESALPVKVYDAGHFSPPVPVTGVSLDSSLILGRGESKKLTVTIAPDNATDTAVEWESSDTNIATVNPSGSVTGVAVGSATITVTTKDGGKTATCDVTVKIKVTSVTLSENSITLAAEEYKTLTATVQPDDAEDKSVTWESSDTGVATVDQAGKITGVAGGIAVITVSSNDGGAAAECVVGVPFTIANATNLGAALTKISQTGNGTKDSPKVFDLRITENITTSGSTNNTITGNYKEVRLTGEKTIALSSNGNLIRAAATQTLVIDGPTLQGIANNENALVYIDGGTVELRSGHIKGNANTSGGGGGVYINTNGTFTMKDGSISGNTSTGSGGGVYIWPNGTFTMEGGTISENETSSDGGGVYVNENGTFIMEDGTISKNEASRGGGVYFRGGRPSSAIKGGTISENEAATIGGGVCVIVGTFTMEDGIIQKNTAANGGGVYVAVNATFTMKNGTVSGNTATTESGGNGVYVLSGGTFNANGGTVSDAVVKQNEE